ncbi:phenoloxidase-activating factor 2-like [Drosophila ficusphila]|uniref:phenoloxidase-activating factor 2-like n=1 Tax=Drosophila ficusphila TaxID=30025 RepID=UPI0007E6F70F|nr:phenoloxidase-activating factor 2-like [Drosophila ficusphila]
MSRFSHLGAIFLGCLLYGVAGQHWIIPPLSDLQSGANELCGLSNPDGLGIDVKVTDGYSRPGEYPWVVALFSKGQFFAGGSLIKPGVVLTASHLLESKVAEDIMIRAGAWNIAARAEQLPHEERQVTSIVRHENFTFATGGNNIALLFLSLPFELKTHIRTMCLPRQGKSFDQGRCFVAGWGKVSYQDSQLSNVQKKIQLPLVNREVCQDQLRKTPLGPDSVLPDSLLCAGGERNKDTCRGDGGSPLFCPMEGDPERYEQAGIVNWGIKCGTENIPAIYTNVALFRDWIDQHVANKPQF